MEFQERYVRDSEKADVKNRDKKPIGDDAFAIGDMIEQLIKKIEQTRLSLNG